jgi:high-affinity Fe2+/Pb2+ permease
MGFPEGLFIASVLAFIAFLLFGHVGGSLKYIMAGIILGFAVYVLIWHFFRRHHPEPQHY